VEEERLNDMLNDAWNLVFSGENDDKTGRQIREMLEEKYCVHDARMFFNIMRCSTEPKPNSVA